MTDRPGPSVCQLLGDLHAYRVQTMPPADLQVKHRQRQLLEDTADRAAFVKAGDVVEPFALPEVHGGTIELDRLLAAGPVVLLFFPLRGCPACNIALRYYQTELYPALTELWGHAGRAQSAGAAPTGHDQEPVRIRLPGGVGHRETGWLAASASRSPPARQPRPRRGPTAATSARFWAPPVGAAHAHHRRDRPGPGGPVRGRPPRLAGCGPKRKPSSRPCARWSPCRPDRLQQSCVRRLHRHHRPERGPSCPRRFGLGFLSHLHGTSPPHQLYRDYLELFVAAEELGFDSAWVAQHHFDAASGRLPSPFTFLAAVAERTRRIHLGTAVLTLPLEDPVRVAEDAAVLDALSGGRVELGVGSGADPAVFAAFGKDLSRRREVQLRRRGHAGRCVRGRAGRGHGLPAAARGARPGRAPLAGRVQPGGRAVRWVRPAPGCC